MSERGRLEIYSLTEFIVVFSCHLLLFSISGFNDVENVLWAFIEGVLGLLCMLMGHINIIEK